MKYTNLNPDGDKMFWKSVLRFKIKVNPFILQELESLNFKGDPRYVHVNWEGKVTIGIYGPDKVEVGKEVGVIAEFRNDGRKRITIVTELTGQFLEPTKGVVCALCDWAGFCEKFTVKLLESLKD